MIRAFVAVEIPQALRQEVAALESEFQSTGADVKWVQAQNLHLTLKFLSDMEEKQVEFLTEALRRAVSGKIPFSIWLEGIGAFPRTTNPRVVWVGVAQGKEDLENLAAGVEAACAPLGFPPEERPFSAHLTIGRVRSRDRLAGLIKKLQVAEFRGSAPAPVTRLSLFQSTLSPHGPLYTCLAEIPLGPDHEMVN